MDTEEYKLAKLYAMRRLSRQSMLSSALAKALQQRSISEEIIEHLIVEFTRLGYLNDEAWVEGYVRGQTRRKQGPRAIAAKLINKGIARDEVSEVLSPLKSDEQQKSAILDLLATRYKQRDLKDQRERQKVIASLMRRGFNLSAILDLVKSNGNEE